jgi:hypothetical protein
MVEVPADKNDGEKKVYNECLVQYASAGDAKKCLNSPAAVLNNRFIKLNQANFNIIPLEEVKPLTAQQQFEEDQERERLSREKRGPKTFNKGIPKKYIRSNDDKNDSIVEGEYDHAPKIKPPKLLEAKQKADVAVMNQYDDLRKLREQVDLISKKKEQIFETQIENYRTLIAKGKDEHIHHHEAKIMDLQKQLNALREEREKSTKKPEMKSPSGYSGGRIPQRGRGGRFSRGGRSGRFSRGGRFGSTGRGIEAPGTSEVNETEDFDPLAEAYINGFVENTVSEEFFEETGES